jgi:Uma2 family endonuclease
MLAHKSKLPATYADIEALPAHMVGQILFGVLHAHPRPAPRHARAFTRLISEIDGPFDRGRDGPGGWIVLGEPELHLGPHIVVPDIGAWRRERLPRLPQTAYFETPPDWVCEVLSPSTARLDRTDKLAVYAEFKVRHCWLVDPIALTLEVFELSAGRWTLHSTYKDADPVCAPPFAEHTFALNVLWPDEQMPD